MRLYAGTSQQFIQDNIQNQIAEKLRLAFEFHFRSKPSPNEVNSWRNSLRSLSQVVQYAHLLYHGIILEYQLPLSSKRLDCIICGRDQSGKDNAVIIELKQWDKCEGNDIDKLVTTWVGGGMRDVLHPSVQVGQYQMYLKDVHTVFYNPTMPIELSACAYLHNYHYIKDDVILSDKYKDHIDRCPLFSADDVERLKDYLVPRLEGGEGIEVLTRIEESKYRPSRKLMLHVSDMIKSKSEYVLLDEQLVVYEKVLGSVKKGFHDKQKTVIIAKGGPGTGKSVIAINLMSDLLRSGYNAHYATGSKAFTETLRAAIGTRGSVQFKYFNSYMQAERDVVDVMIADEAHRIRKTSNNRFTKKDSRSDLAQIDELIRASKVCVFFIDDKQVVRPDEIGSVEYIQNAAKDNKCYLHEYELDIQFRCGGSDVFVNWISNTLGVERTPNVIWEGDHLFDFRIFDSPLELEQAIKQKVQDGHTARMAAGFCWPWSNPKKDGTLVDDVVVGDYQKPWNARPDAGRLSKDIPKASLWAYDPNGINQIGCIYTAQGFEFDYAGVIIGNDLVYDPSTASWQGNKQNSYDNVVKRSNSEFVDLVKNTYRVLLTRGLKGCYVHFVDENTKNFFKSRIEKNKKN